MSMHEMAERIAEAQELERLRVENARLKREVHAAREMAKLFRRWWEASQAQNAEWPVGLNQRAMQPMTVAEQNRFWAARQQEMEPASLFGGLTGARWP